MYEIRIPDPETLKDNPWWKSGGEILYSEMAVGPFSIEDDSKILPALPEKIKQSYNTCFCQKWSIDQEDFHFIYAPSWVCFEIMRMAQLIKNSEKCPLKHYYHNDDGFALVKKPADSKLNKILEDEGCFECGGYFILDRDWFGNNEQLKQFESLAIPCDEALLLKSELALLPSDEYDMDDMIYVGEQNPEEELNEGEGFYDDDEDEEGEDWKN